MIKDFVIHLQHKLLLEVKDKIITSLEWIDILNKILDALSLLSIKNNCRLSIDPLSNENKNQLEGTCWFLKWCRLFVSQPQKTCRTIHSPKKIYDSFKKLQININMFAFYFRHSSITWNLPFNLNHNWVHILIWMIKMNKRLIQHQCLT